MKYLLIIFFFYSVAFAQDDLSNLPTLDLIQPQEVIIIENQNLKTLNVENPQIKKIQFYNSNVFEVKLSKAGQKILLEFHDSKVGDIRGCISDGQIDIVLINSEKDPDIRKRCRASHYDSIQMDLNSKWEFSSLEEALHNGIKIIESDYFVLNRESNQCLDRHGNVGLNTEGRECVRPRGEMREYFSNYSMSFDVGISFTKLAFQSIAGNGFHFPESGISYPSYHNNSIVDAFLNFTHFYKADFHKTTFSDSRFLNATISESRIEESILARNLFTLVKFIGTQFVDSNLIDNNANNFKCTNCTFDNTYFHFRTVLAMSLEESAIKASELVIENLSGKLVISRSQITDSVIHLAFVNELVIQDTEITNSSIDLENITGKVVFERVKFTNTDISKLQNKSNIIFKD